MKKTRTTDISFEDLTVDTAGLQALTNAGIKTATEIGMAAGAKIYVGRRVLWNVAKIRKYLDEISEWGDKMVVEFLKKGKQKAIPSFITIIKAIE